MTDKVSDQDYQEGYEFKRYLYGYKYEVNKTKYNEVITLFRLYLYILLICFFAVVVDVLQLIFLC